MWKVIINPTAGSGKAEKKVDEVATKLKAANIPHEFAFTEHQGHATELSRQAVEDGFRQIIVLGGDGSNHDSYDDGDDDDEDDAYDDDDDGGWLWL